MRLVPILACVGLALGLASSASAQLVSVLGTLVALAPPNGFTLAKTFSGFENKRGGSSITVEPGGIKLKTSGTVQIGGDAKVETKGGVIHAEASGDHEIKGAVVKLN